MSLHLPAVKPEPHHPPSDRDPKAEFNLSRECINLCSPVQEGMKGKDLGVKVQSLQFLAPNLFCFP